VPVKLQDMGFRGVIAVDLKFVALYVGPDQMMPVASVLATVAGFVMIFWNKVVGVVRRVFGGKPPADTADPSSSTKEPPPQP
jgi:hypothetical protein